MTITKLPLSDADARCLLSALQDAGDVHTESDFISWSSETLQAVLPHEMMHCYLGMMNNGRLTPLKWLKKRYPTSCMRQFEDAQGTIMTPFMRLSGATGAVQLFQPDRDTVLSTLELQQFHHHELSNIAAHVQSCAITGLTSYFSFSQIAEPLSVRHGRVLALLVPHMHAALNRIVGAEREQSAAAPDSVAANVTPREREVLDWIMEGKTNWEISQIFGCSASTVKTHLQRIYAKLGVTGRAKAAALWACRAAAPGHAGVRHANGVFPASPIKSPGST